MHIGYMLYSIIDYVTIWTVRILFFLKVYCLYAVYVDVDAFNMSFCITYKIHSV